MRNSIKIAYLISTTFLMILISSNYSYTQDYITLKSGKTIEVEIVEVNESEITYYVFPKSMNPHKIKLHRNLLKNYSYNSEIKADSIEINSAETINSENEESEKAIKEKHPVDKKKTGVQGSEPIKKIQPQQLTRNKFAFRTNLMHMIYSDFKLGVEWPVEYNQSIELDLGIRKRSSLLSTFDEGYFDFTGRYKIFQKSHQKTKSTDIYHSIPEGFYYAIQATVGSYSTDLSENSEDYYFSAGLDGGVQFTLGNFLFDIFTGVGLGYIEHNEIGFTNSFVIIEDSQLVISGGWRIGYVF